MKRYLNPDPSQLENPTIEWAKGLHERRVLRLELAKYSNHTALVVVVVLMDGSLYRIKPPSMVGSSVGGGTIKNITWSDPKTQPVVSIAFNSHYIDLSDVLHICYSVRVHHGRILSTENWHWFFGLAAILSAVREALPIKSTLSRPPPMNVQSPLRLLWNDVYELTRQHEQAFWKGSLLERTKHFTREVICEAAYQVLQENSRLNGFKKETIFSIIARAEYLGSKEHNSRRVPQDLAWDQSWSIYPRAQSWLLRPLLWVVRECNTADTRNLSSQIDARDMPHPYPVTSMLSDTRLISEGLVGYDWTAVAIRPDCALNCNGNHINPKTSGSQASCQCQVWVSDWQIASCKAWEAAWAMAVEHGENVARSSSPSIPGVTTRAHQSRWAKSWTLAALKWAFKHLGKAAKQLKGRIKSGRNGCMGPQPTSSIPRPTIAMQVAQQPRQCIVNEESYGERLYQEFKEQAHDEALLLLNKGDKTGATARNTINRLSENFLADLADKAWNRAIENMRQQDTQTNYFAEEEWRKILSTNFMLKHFPKGGLWAEEWKKEFEDIFEQAWRTSWKNAWNAAWDDAYDSIISKGIDFGIETALADPNGSHNKLYNNHRQLITRLKQVESYHQIKATIHRETISDSLKCIQSLIKDLYHLTDLLQHTAHSAHGNFVTAFALVPSTAQTELEDIARDPFNQTVLQNLSYDYFQLRTFIMENYVSKLSVQDQEKFPQSMDQAWKLFTDLKNGKPTRWYVQR